MVMTLWQAERTAQQHVACVRPDLRGRERCTVHEIAQEHVREEDQHLLSALWLHRAEACLVSMPLQQLPASGPRASDAVPDPAGPAELAQGRHGYSADYHPSRHGAHACRHSPPPWKSMTATAPSQGPLHAPASCWGWNHRTHVYREGPWAHAPEGVHVCRQSTPRCCLSTVRTGSAYSARGSGGRDTSRCRYGELVPVHESWSLLEGRAPLQLECQHERLRPALHQRRHPAVCCPGACVGGPLPGSIPGGRSAVWDQPGGLRWGPRALGRGGPAGQGAKRLLARRRSVEGVILFASVLGVRLQPGLGTDRRASRIAGTSLWSPGSMT